MKNSLIFVSIAVVFLFGVIMGYVIHEVMIPLPISNTNTNYGPIELFLGSWSASEMSDNESNQMEISYMWSFYQNQSSHLITEFQNGTLDNTLDAWRIYIVTNNSLTICSSQGKPISYEYSFSDNNQKLTLTSNNIPLTFTKQ